MSKGNRTRRKAAGLLPAQVFCTARTTAGNPCQRPPVSGATVCWHHGGNAPQVVAAARRRLMAASNNMAVLLMRIAEDETTPAAVRVAAIKDVLDRAGVTVKQEVEITVQPWQAIVEGIVSEVPDEQIRTLGALNEDDTVDAEVVEPVLTKAVALPPAPGPTPPPEQRIPSRRRRGNRLAGH